MKTDICYPLLFNESLHTKVWGGYSLASNYNKGESDGIPIGESYEIYSKNIISNGQFAGRSLQSVIEEYPKQMIGESRIVGDYPIMVKLLDAREWLSVQIHPNDAQASELEGLPRGKTECWHILEAVTDSQIIYGIESGISKAEVLQAIKNNATQNILRFVTVKSGDFIYVPAGIVHAVGPGILLYELQQTSDTTYRLYDWDRAGLDGEPRELHIEKALHCINFADISPFDKLDNQQSIMIVNSFFSLEKLEKFNDYQMLPEAHERLMTIIKGGISLHNAEGNISLSLKKGQSAFIPACFPNATVASNGEAVVLIARRAKILYD